MSRKTKGILCILGAAFFFSLMGVFVRLAGDIPSMQKSFFRNCVAMLFAATVLWKNKIPVKIGRENYLAMAVRVTAGTLGIICNFYAVEYLLLADASILNKLSPFFAILFSYLILKEKVSLFQGACILVAFGGAVLIVKPGFVGMDMIPAMVGVAGGIGAGLAYTMVRIMGGRGVKGPVIVFCFSAFSTLVLLPNLIMNFVPMTAVQLILLLLTGLSAAGGQFCITAAYTFAPARELSVYDYSQVVFSALWGFFFFSQIPDLYSVLGYIIIIGVSVVMFLKNQKGEAAS